MTDRDRIVADRYRLDREVGRGGMGAVWLATDVVLDRQVAVKRVGLMPGTDQADVDRVSREARVSAMLNHEHVVAVYDLVTDAEDHWLVMEYVASRNLSQVIRSRGQLTPDETAPLVAQVAVALGEAHRAGIVHRDVKPGNVLVTDDGRVKLTDFGIARTGSDPSLTQTGLVTGSPGYIAPEVAAGGTATEASDLWSLGATVFHAVTGHPPYDTSGNLIGALYRIVHEEPPRTDRAGWLAPLLESTMHRDPAARWSADQVATFLASGPGTAVPAPVPPPTEAAGPAAVPATAPLPQSGPAQSGPAPSGPAQSSATQSGPAPSGPAQSGSEHTQVMTSARRRRGRGTVLAVLAAVLVLGLFGWLLTREDDEPDGGAASAGDPTGQSESPADEDGPTEEGMSTFVRGYLSTVTEDPGTTWERLTPAFQKKSGNFGQYQKFWRPIASAEVSDLAVDTEAMTVSYHVEYDKTNGDTLEDDRTLLLEYVDGEYLIADEFARF